MSGLVWVELDKTAPDHNLQEIKKLSKKGTLFCAVVKSNAYGHGAKEITSLLPSADWFAVNSLEEGIELRDFGIKKPILLLGYVSLSQLKEALDADLRLTVYNHETLDRIAELIRNTKIKNPPKIHLKIETGTGRQGILPEEIPDFINHINRIKGLLFEGVSTHYANIEDTINSEYAKMQLKVFKNSLEKIMKSGAKPKLVHSACTAASILFPETHFSMLRAGIGVYGLWPSRETYLSALLSGRYLPDLRPVLSWKTKIVQIKTIPEGHYIGYGCTYRTTRKTRLAVLPVGYADGYDRALGNTAHVLVKGKRAPVIGRVCMNLTMIDVTDIPNAKLEDEVVLLGKDGEEVISAEQMANWAGTINYEIVTRISPFLSRKIV